MSLFGSNHLSKSRVFIPLRHYNMMLCTISISIANIDYLFQDLANNDLTMGEFVMRAN
jgi:BarA-like signal transduction histidine kinase